jgi:hypothetical protein
MVPTHVVNIHVLVIAYILVLEISRDNKLMTSRDRNLNSLVNHREVE